MRQLSPLFLFSILAIGAAMPAAYAGEKPYKMRLRLGTTVSTSVGSGEYRVPEPKYENITVVLNPIPGSEDEAKGKEGDFEREVALPDGRVAYLMLNLKLYDGMKSGIINLSIGVRKESGHDSPADCGSFSFGSFGKRSESAHVTSLCATNDGMHILTAEVVGPKSL